MPLRFPGGEPAVQVEKKERAMPEEFRKQVQQLLDSYQHVFDIFGGGLGVRFKAGERDSVDALQSTVSIDVSGWEERGIPAQHAVWMALQRLEQIKSVHENPAEYRSRLLHERAAGARAGALRLLRETFDTIYGAASVERNVAVFGPHSEAARSVRGVYQEKLMPQTDLTDLPEHVQFARALLRAQMVPDEELTVSPAVEEALEAAVRFSGKDYTPKELIERFIQPARGRNTSAQMRNMVLERALEPLYERLIHEEDLLEDGRGNGLPEDADMELPPEEQDEMLTHDMETAEGEDGGGPYVFRIDPGVTGYYKGGVHTVFDQRTLFWRKDKRLSAYRAAVRDAPHEYRGLVREGLTCLPLPYGCGADTASVPHGVELLQDQHGTLYAQSGAAREVSLRFGGADFEGNDDPALFSEEIFQGGLSRETERHLEEIGRLGGAGAMADALQKFIHEKYSYHVKNQDTLRRSSQNAPDYMRRIDAAQTLECLTSNIFFVALCRRLGVPARLVRGHYVKTKDTEGGARITGQTGHAWSEIWDGYEWVLKDATPPGSGQDGEPQDGQVGSEQLSTEQLNELEQKLEQEKRESERAQEQERKEKEKSPEQRAQEAQQGADKGWCERKGVSYKDLQKFERVEREIWPYLQETSRLWRHIVYGARLDVRIRETGHYKTGLLDVQQAIMEYPQLEMGRYEQVRVMTRRTVEEEKVRMPELIRVHLVGDLSGSMGEAGSEKRHILNQCFVLIMSSLDEFNRYLNMTRAQTKTRLRAQTEGWTFGSVVRQVKRQIGRGWEPVPEEKTDESETFLGEKPSKADYLLDEGAARDDRAEMVGMLARTSGDTLGGTDDNKPLERIAASLTPEDKRDIRKGKIMELVIEVTDGGSGTPIETMRAIEELEDDGVVVRAFQIGEVSHVEEKLFEQVWNGEGLEEALEEYRQYLKKIEKESDPENEEHVRQLQKRVEFLERAVRRQREQGTRRGARVPSIDKLLPAMTAVLINYLRDVRL